MRQIDRSVNDGNHDAWVAACLGPDGLEDLVQCQRCRRLGQIEVAHRRKPYVGCAVDRAVQALSMRLRRSCVQSPGPGVESRARAPRDRRRRPPTTRLTFGLRCTGSPVTPAKPLGLGQPLQTNTGTGISRSPSTPPTRPKSGPRHRRGTDLLPQAQRAWSTRCGSNEAAAASRPPLRG